MTKFKIIILLLVFLVISCKQQQQARMPISQSSGTFMNESVERNKKLIKNEEAQIAAIVKNDSKTTYIASKKGYWYYYDIKNEKDSLHPKKGDIATFSYEIKDLKGTIIYTAENLKTQTNVVKKQNYEQNPAVKNVFWELIPWLL